MHLCWGVCRGVGWCGIGRGVGGSRLFRRHVLTHRHNTLLGISQRGGWCRVGLRGCFVWFVSRRFIVFERVDIGGACCSAIDTIEFVVVFVAIFRETERSFNSIEKSHKANLIYNS